MANFRVSGFPSGLGPGTPGVGHTTKKDLAKSKTLLGKGKSGYIISVAALVLVGYVAVLCVFQAPVAGARDSEAVAYLSAVRGADPDEKRGWGNRLRSWLTCGGKGGNPKPKFVVHDQQPLLKLSHGLALCPMPSTSQAYGTIFNNGVTHSEGANKVQTLEKLLSGNHIQIQEPIPPVELLLSDDYVHAGSASGSGESPHAVPHPSSERRHMRVVAISDTHGHHRELEMPPGDILIHAGDFTGWGERDIVEDFNQWLGELTQYKYKVVIAGNHEYNFDQSLLDDDMKRGLFQRDLEAMERSGLDTTNSNSIKNLLTNAVYLENDSVDIYGVHIFGTPMSPEFMGSTGFQLPEDQIRHFWGRMPTTHNRYACHANQGHVDILIVHGPPLGHGDRTVSDRRAGCPDLLDWIETHRPGYVITGHIHEGYGVSKSGRGPVVINAASTGINMETGEPILYPPIVFDVATPLPV